MIGENAMDQVRARIAAGRRHSVAVAAGGVVLTAGRGSSGERDVAGWSDIVAVAAGNVHTASNTGRSHTVGLRGDGTVVAVGWNTDGQCDTDGWTNVVNVAAGWRRTVAVRADGTAVAAGRQKDGANAIDDWRDLVAISAGDWHTVAIRGDGTAVAVGNGRRGQCAVDGWRGLRGISAGYLHTVGLTRDHRVKVGDLPKGERLTERVQQYFAVKGINAGRLNHFAPAAALLRDTKYLSRLNDATLDRAETLFAQINKLPS